MRTFILCAQLHIHRDIRVLSGDNSLSNNALNICEPAYFKDVPYISLWHGVVLEALFNDCGFEPAEEIPCCHPRHDVRKRFSRSLSSRILRNNAGCKMNGHSSHPLGAHSEACESKISASHAFRYEKSYFTFILAFTGFRELRAPQ